MSSFDHLEYSKIPIRENQRRIQFLAVFRDLLVASRLTPNPTDFSSLAIQNGRPLNLGEVRDEIEERKPLAQKMIALAGIKSLRQCVRVRGEGYVEVDVIEQCFYVENLGASYTEPATVVGQAIGVYKHDQERARARTRNPIFWLYWLVDWISASPFWTEKSRSGKVAKGTLQFGVLLGLLVSLFHFLAWLLQQAVNILELFHGLNPK